MRNRPVLSPDGRFLIGGDGPGAVCLLDRRMGVSWPTVHHPGYFAVVGTEEWIDPVAKDRRRWFLDEGEHQDRDAFFQDLCAAAFRWKCSGVWLEIGETNKLIAGALSRHLREHGIGSPLPVRDCAGLTGFKAAFPIISKLRENGLLEIPQDSLLYQDISTMVRDDLKTQDGLPADERRHRVAALNHVAISYDYTPVTPRRKTKGGSSPTEGYS